MYVTIYAHEPDLLAVLDLIMTGLIRVDVNSARMMVEDEGFYTSQPEMMMLF